MSRKHNVMFCDALGLAKREVSFLTYLLCLRVPQMSRYPDLAIFVLTADTIPLPLVHMYNINGRW